MGGSGYSIRPKNVKNCIKLNYNFQRGGGVGEGGGVKNKFLPWGSYGYFQELKNLPLATWKKNRKPELYL